MMVVKRRRRSKLFWISRVLVAAACALLVYSFVVLDGGSGGGSGENIEEMEGIQKSEREEKISGRKDPRLVFMVIDAFRLSFLTSPESPMSFTKSSILTSPNAFLFDAYARMPTVTLPRITAYITGTLPSFGTILTNLATDEIKIENWISGLEKLGKRIHFFGDDTWIRLLPGKFEKSEGVTSFFVNDYTEVDSNVTRHLDSEFRRNSKFDILILHYLGLDHIGHSLGGTSPKIEEKLKEMDGIIEKIHGFLTQDSEDLTSSEDSGDQESYFIICGDHGMTPAGSHGGASPEETRVPVIIFKIGGDSKLTKVPKSKNPEDVPRIEQIDVSATIFDIFDLNFPPESYGISLINYFRGGTQEDEIRDLKKQHEHFKQLVKAKNLPISDICDDDTKCDYSQKFVQKSLRKWFRKVQEELIGTASEIPNTSIWICVFMLIGTTVTSSWIPQSSKSNLLIFLINVINFASSLIEEEHEIWYYLGSTVVAIRVGKWIIRRRKERGWDWGELSPLLTLAFLHRISYGYCQSSRRRWSMDPNLLPESAFSEVFDFKVNDLNSVLKSQPILVIGGSFLFWMVYSGKNRAMIILPAIDQILRSLEVIGFSSHFHQIIQLSVIPITYFHGSFLLGLFPLLLSIVPISQLLLSFFVFRIGRLSQEFEFGDVENLIFFMSSFFYFGNSNSLSTLSLTSAYVGLLDYYPILVGIQLLLYTYAGPFLYVFGRNSSSTSSESTTESWLQLLFSYRISSLATSLICLYHFQNHLFVWSVYSPKVVYDMAHVLFSGVLSAFL